jgi:hypothetical protein
MAKKTHRAQHFVPQSYLRPWLDSTPVVPGRSVEPYVWVFDRWGASPRRRAPANLFTETDMYTIPTAEGGRDLRFEHGLSGLEDQYTRVRNRTFQRGVWPDARDMEMLLLFVIAAQFRTKASRDHWTNQWGRIRSRAESMQKQFDEASPEQRRRMAQSSTFMSRDNAEPVDLDRLRELEERPIQALAGMAFKTILPIMKRMSVAVFHTRDPLGFITSDTPCVWYDPQAYKRPPFYRGTGIATRTVEVTMPLTPQMCLLISHHASIEGYIEADAETLDALNRRHVGLCDEYFVARSNETRSTWFEIPPLPDDAWERLHPPGGTETPEP